MGHVNRNSIKQIKSMKSVCYFLCGVFMTLTMIVFIIDFWGREFIQDYWIEQLWYGELEPIYRTITTIILFIDFITLYVIITTHVVFKLSKIFKI